MFFCIPNPLDDPLAELHRVAQRLQTTDYVHGDTYREVCLLRSLMTQHLHDSREWPLLLHKYSKVFRTPVYMKHRYSSPEDTIEASQDVLRQDLVASFVGRERFDVTTGHVGEGGDR